MWIVTREHNAYDQFGEYFVAVFTEKPEFKDLKALNLHESDATIGKLTRGGGRHKWEDTWYNLHEIECGKKL